MLSICLLIGVRGNAQKFAPKTIQFKGDPEYSDKELMQAAGLKTGVVLTSAEMNEHSKLLMDSGVFDNLTFKFDGQDLIFSLVPATMLYPVRIENLPLTSGKELDDRLRGRFPLYHGKVPAEGSLLEGVKAAMQEMLAAQGIKAAVTAAPFGIGGTHKISAINFAIAETPVVVGAIELHGVSPEQQVAAKKIADRTTGSTFDTDNSTANIELAFSNFYADEGYPAVKVHAVRSGAPVATAESIGVPFAVTVDAGKLYKLGAVHLATNSVVTSADLNKITAQTNGSTKGPSVRAIWAMIHYLYESKGYLDCKITPHPEFNEAAGTVDYTVDIQPGAVYHLGLVRFENVSDDLRKLLMRNWQMLPGDPFNKSYVENFFLSAQKTDPVLQRTLAMAKESYEIRADPESHEVNLVIRLEKR
jgi:outer membrane protein assembly factor BamA